ncbi:MAG TPA: MOSC domain-containing protein [Mycobacteriales bacterium]|nr:MOSC domain-containing protein [Mycobacteriales bacterium]
MRVVSVNAGKAVPVDYQTTSLPTTAIDKRPVAGVVRITEAGLDGDESADTRNHHDAWMRVYAYSVEDYRWWSEQLDAELRPGLFAENLTTEGIDLNAALVGEVWRVGTALLQISHVRTPCQTFKGWMGHVGLDATAWVKRFTQAGRPGPYFRVLEEGAVAAGDAIVVEQRPAHDVTVGELFRALTMDRSLLPRLLVVEGLKPWVREEAEAAAASR